MTNQYTGVRKATPLEIAERDIRGLTAENNIQAQQIAELLEMLKAIWLENKSPDIARLLIQHGVEAAYGAEYTTPRRLDVTMAEIARLTAELETAREILANNLKVHMSHAKGCPGWEHCACGLREWEERRNDFVSQGSTT